MEETSKTGMFFTILFANVAAFLLIDFVHSISGKVKVVYVNDTLKDGKKEEKKEAESNLENFELRKTVDKLKDRFKK